MDKSIFHKIKYVIPLDDYRLFIHFFSGISKIYDVKPLFKWRTVFLDLKNNNLFYGVEVSEDHNAVIWNDQLDISSEELFMNGKEVKTPFDKLISMNDATSIWGLNESTLRKAISYGKFKVGIDVNKYGKQWVVNIDSMIREYGEPN